MNLAIDAKEGRDVTTADIAGAYLFVEMREKVMVKLKGETVDVLCNTNEKYRKYICVKKGR